MATKMTQEEFIAKAQAKHGNKFDYSQTEYIRSGEKVTIRCIEHNNTFSQFAGAHLTGKNGCQECNGQKPINKEEFVKRAVAGHGEGKFDYSLISDSMSGSVHDKVSIICLKHNITFEQSAWVHLHPSNGCPKCVGNRKKTLEDIIETSAEKLPGLSYDYSEVDLQAKTTEKVVIGCYKQEHGQFEQSLSNHWSGRTGCPECKGDKKSAKKAQKKG